MNWHWKIIAAVVGAATMTVLVMACIIFSSPVEGFFRRTFFLMVMERYGIIAGALVFMIAATIIFASPTPGKAWRRAFIGSALCCFAFPVCVFISSSLRMPGLQDGAQRAGEVMGKGLLLSSVGVPAGLVGVVLLIIGLLLGRSPMVQYPESGESV